MVVLLEPWFSNRTRSIIKSPKLYFSDTGLLCALLNIRTESVMLESPLSGAIWETFVFQRLRINERYGYGGGLYFWRDRTRELDFVIDCGGRLDLVEAKFSELPADSDATNLRFVRDIVGAKKAKRMVVACRAPNAYPLSDGARAESPLEWI